MPSPCPPSDVGVQTRMRSAASTAASVALLGYGNGVPHFSGLAEALAVPESHLRLFGKPECRGHRRLAVAVASADTLDEARARAKLVASKVKITLE